MSLNKRNILGIKITSASKSEILEYIGKYLFIRRESVQKSKKTRIKPLQITTPNPEQIVLAKQDIRFRNFLNNADLTLPDGIGIVLAAKLLGASASSARITKRIAGIDFMTDLVALADRQGVRIGLIGGFDGLAVRAFECLTERYPKLKGWAMDGPEITYRAHGVVDAPGAPYWSQIADRIISSDTRIVFVGLGAPKQEYAMEKIADAITVKYGGAPVVCMAVGGSFTMLTKKLPRAPLVIRSIGFEWFWRLVQEPWRWKRQLALVQFIWMVCVARINLPNQSRRI